MKEKMPILEPQCNPPAEVADILRLATWQSLKADDPIEIKVFPRNRRICRAELI